MIQSGVAFEPMSLDPSHSIDESAFSANASRSLPHHPAEAAESPLRESELKYQRLIEGIGGDYVIYTHDPDGVITYVSPSIENALGFPVRAVLGLNWRDLIGEHFIGRELADRVEGEVAEGKKFYNFTVEIKHADGETRLIEVQQQPLFDVNGKYVSMEGIAKDVTEISRDAEELRHLKAELEQRVASRTAELILSNELLRKSEARYRSLVECQSEFVVRWLPGAVITFVNQAFCRYSARTSDDLLGWSFLPIIHPEDVPAFHATIDKLDQRDPFVIFECRIVLQDGSTRWTQWTIKMLFDESGEFLEYQSVGRDITDLKVAADTIREKEGHLAYVSRLATMGEMVAGMAHEIHQPLHAAKTFAEAARRNLEMGSPKNIETAIDCTKEISNAVSRTAKIIRGLREFTRSRPIEFELLDLNEVVHQASELIVFETRQAQVHLEYNLTANLPLVQGDLVQIQQLCVNLLINTYEAMVEIPVENRQVLIRTSHNELHVRLSFQDFGCSIDEDNLDVIFNAFYTTKQHRMGMGLSLCKSIAEAHGGKIWGERNEAEGMTFVLELPAIQHSSSELSERNQI